MSYSGDGEGWQHFDVTYPEFAAEERNIRVALCTDGFSPFGQLGVVIFLACDNMHDLDQKNYPPDLHIWDALEEVEDGRTKGRRLGFGTRTQSTVFNPVPQSFYARSDLSVVDLATKDLLAIEVEKRKALEEEITVLRTNQVAQDSSYNELRQMMLTLQNQVDQNVIGGSSSAVHPDK
ncbi:hypothetical protein LIER_19047 [Lithospermum erythrorhizon]|uniref:Uncharacterized protein n=1 Tax=Lithospermum erythrorhizon TaxID=34254 RepID=A0AAV3QIX3_LITER